MLETRLVYSGIQGICRTDGKSPTYYGPFPEDQPASLEELSRGANYVVHKTILRDGTEFGQILTAANESTPTLSVHFQMFWDSLKTARYFMDFYDLFMTNFFVKPRKEPEGLHLYGLSPHDAKFITEDPKDKAFRERLISCGEAPVIINETIPDNVYKFEEFMELLKSGSITSLLTYFEIWSSSLGKLGFALNEDEIYSAHIVSGLNFTPILQQLLEPTDSSKQEKQQFIGFVEKMASREGLQLGLIHKN